MEIQRLLETSVTFYKHVETTPQISSQKILDNYYENQKFLSKLSTWSAMRWSSQVQGEHLIINHSSSLLSLWLKKLA